MTEEQLIKQHKALQYWAEGLNRAMYRAQDDIRASDGNTETADTFQEHRRNL